MIGEMIRVCSLEMLLYDGSLSDKLNISEGSQKIGWKQKFRKKKKKLVKRGFHSFFAVVLVCNAYFSHNIYIFFFPVAYVVTSISILTFSVAKFGGFKGKAKGDLDLFLLQSQTWGREIYDVAQRSSEAKTLGTRQSDIYICILDATNLKTLVLFCKLACLWKLGPRNFRFFHPKVFFFPLGKMKKKPWWLGLFVCFSRKRVGVKENRVEHITDETEKFFILLLEGRKLTFFTDTEGKYEKLRQFH